MLPYYYMLQVLYANYKGLVDLALPLPKLTSLERPEKEITSKVLHLAGPALAEMLLISFVSMADMMMVGRLGPQAVASVGLTNQPMFFALAIFMALNVGTTALVARFTGANNDADAAATARQSLLITACLAVVVSLLGVFAAPYVLRFMRADADVMQVGIPYFQVVAAGLFFNTVSMGITAILRGSGDTRTPMRINMFINILNVIGNYALIYGHFGLPRLEVTGAGLATTLSRAVAAALFVVILFSGRSRIKLSLRDDYRPNLQVIRRIFNIGLNSAIEQFILRGGQVTFARVVSGLGTAVFASHQIGLNILSLSFMPGQAFGIAATTLVGQSLGAKDPELAAKCGSEARRLGMYVGTFMALLFFLFGRQIAGLYTDNVEVIARTALVLRVYAFLQPAQSTQFILAGALRGAGDTRWPLYSTALGIWGGRVAFSWLFINIFGLGLLGAWLAMALDQLGRSIFISVRFKSGKWKAIRV